MKSKFNLAWYIILSLAVTTLICIANPIINLFHFTGFFRHLALGFILALPLALIFKSKL